MLIWASTWQNGTDHTFNIYFSLCSYIVGIMSLEVEPASTFFLIYMSRQLFFCCTLFTGPCSAVSNMYGNRWESDCRSRGRDFDPGPVPYFGGDWSLNNFYGHSSPFHWIIQEGLLSVTSESMCTKYWLTACSSLLRKKCGQMNWPSQMTIAVDFGHKATKQTEINYCTLLTKGLVNVHGVFISVLPG